MWCLWVLKGSVIIPEELKHLRAGLEVSRPGLEVALEGGAGTGAVPGGVEGPAAQEVVESRFPLFRFAEEAEGLDVLPGLDEGTEVAGAEPGALGEAAFLDVALFRHGQDAVPAPQFLPGPGPEGWGTEVLLPGDPAVPGDDAEDVLPLPETKGEKEEGGRVYAVIPGPDPGLEAIRQVIVSKAVRAEGRLEVSQVSESQAPGEVEGGEPVEVVGELDELPRSFPDEVGVPRVDVELAADPEVEGEVVGDDTDSSVGLASDNGNLGSIMADLESIISALGGGREEEEEALPDDQYGA